MRWLVIFVAVVLSGCDGVASENTVEPVFPLEKAAGGTNQGGVELESRRVASSSEDIQASAGTDSFGYPLASVDKREILELLLSQQFEKLSAILLEYQTGL